jgi:hypothetical protein
VVRKEKAPRVVPPVSVAHTEEIGVVGLLPSSRVGPTAQEARKEGHNGRWAQPSGKGEWV